jgi:hypothetical protein
MNIKAAARKDSRLKLYDYLYTQLVVNGKRSVLVDRALGEKFNMPQADILNCISRVMLENNIDRVNLVLVRTA